MWLEWRWVQGDLELVGDFFQLQTNSRFEGFVEVFENFELQMNSR